MSTHTTHQQLFTPTQLVGKGMGLRHTRNGGRALGMERQSGQTWQWFTDPGVVTGGDWSDIGSRMTCGRNRGACPSSECSTPSLSACSRPTIPDGIVLVIDLGERNDPWSGIMICCEIQTRRRMAKHNEITDVSARCQIFEGHVDCTLATNAKNLSYSLKVNKFAALTISELVSRHTGYKPNNVCPTMCRVA